ncbi:hypothetical protein [Caenispirillum bisanense]|uniref:hypothetical protein n=1 Tax=Caenispirillum bisanense TaxID=414052 RepID=UPI0031DCC7A4
MAVFLIVGVRADQGDQLDSAIAKTYQKDHLRLTADSWLVADDCTAKELSDKLGITSGKSGSAVVTKIGSYYGRAPTNIWDWVKTKWESHSDGA